MPADAKQKSPRTYRIVGIQKQIDERDTPHPTVNRGEWGEQLLYRRRHRLERDAVRRTLDDSNNMKGGPNNCFNYLIKSAPYGGVNPEKAPVLDVVEMSKHIKEVARYFGADLVGITHLDQAYVYSHRARGWSPDGEKPGDTIHLPHKFAICLGFAGKYDLYQTCNSKISGLEYMRGNKLAIVPTFMLAACIREMGYPARPHAFPGLEVNPMPLAINAGLGELGRHGMLINEEYGSRLHLSVVTTDLPLAVDEPVDMGVEDVCRLCMKCAQTCPTYSIPFGNKVVVNGVEKWAINVKTCYKSRMIGQEWESCLICTTSCCYNKRSAWWHTLAGWILKKLPIPLRPFYIAPLLWFDDLIWGKRPWRHMKWLNYDNAPIPVKCHIPECIARHKPLELKPLHKIPVKKRALK